MLLQLANREKSAVAPEIARGLDTVASELRPAAWEQRGRKRQIVLRVLFCSHLRRWRVEASVVGISEDHFPCFDAMQLAGVFVPLPRSPDQRLRNPVCETEGVNAWRFAQKLNLRLQLLRNRVQPGWKAQFRFNPVNKTSPHAFEVSEFESARLFETLFVRGVENDCGIDSVARTTPNPVFGGVRAFISKETRPPC